MVLTLIFLKKTSLRKILNAIHLKFEYVCSVFFGRTVRKSYPISLSVEPTTFCNLNCPECPAGTNNLNRLKGNIDFELYKKILDETAPFLMNLILYFQGEPFLNQEIIKMIEYASKEKRVFTSTSTNGHFINSKNAEDIVKSGLDKIIFSIDGFTQETYEKYRKNGNLNTVLNALKEVAEQKRKLKSKTPFIVVQFLVFKFNEHEIPEIKKLCKPLKVDKLEIKSAQIYNYQNAVDLIPTIKKYSRYKQDKSGSFIIKNKLKNRCKRLWESSVITNTGDVLACCFDKNADYSFGNIQTDTFKIINNSLAAKNFREKLSTNRKQIDICKNCTDGLYK